MTHISLVTLGVDDLEAMTRFYTSLGWRRSSASVEGVVAFLVGGTVVLALYGREALAVDAGLPAPPPAGPSHLALATNVPSQDAVDQALARAMAAGGRITRPAESADWGGYSGYFADPDGHHWEVAWNPDFDIE